MKNKYILLLTCMFAFSSCDRFLDITPTGKVIPTTLEEYRALLAGAYAKVPTDRGTVGFRSDEMKVNSSEWDLNSYGDVEIWKDFEQMPSTSEFEWLNYYNTIFIANEVIANRKDIKQATESGLNQLVGEAHLLRAYMHFNLVNLYGQPYTKPGAPQTKSVPIRLKNDLEKVQGRSTVQEVYESINSDIAKARELLNVEKWDELQYTYRFTVNSVNAFQARVDLYMGNWQGAYNNAELTLGKQSTLEDLNDATPILPNKYDSKEVITALERLLNSGAARAALVTPSFASKYSTDDKRPDIYFSTPDANGFRKNEKGGYIQYACTFRTAEFYLTSAEAAAQLNDLAKSRTRLLELMEKRYTPAGFLAKQTTVNTMTKDQLLTEILEERARELAHEGHRWFDLRRTTRPQMVKVDKDGDTHTLQQDDPRYTLRIPKSAIDANPGLNN